MAVHPNGDIIIADYDNKWVSIFSSEGKFKVGKVCFKVFRLDLGASCNYTTFLSLALILFLLSVQLPAAPLT